jgi:pyruvate-ferredoxin/flavodoxin oxidoreductase
MYIANATGCSSIWGNSAPATPYTTNYKGYGPAWANSLFEDNAEFGLGMLVGVKQQRNRIKALCEQLIEGGAKEECKTAAQAWIDSMNDGEASKATSAALVEALSSCDCACDNLKAIRDEILNNKEHLVMKSQWILGGDGWAYDIGYGGLDHVLASGENVNVLVFDTEVYSNTGGQASKASNIGQVAQFAAAGKAIAKKSLAEIAMSYGYVYVAQIAMGADQNQTLKAIKEAEAYNGPSIIIAYAPCEMHSIKGGMINCQNEMKKAVDCGYWNMFRYNPALKAEGQNPFTIDSKPATGSYREFLLNEARYASLTRSFPERAEELFALSEKTATERYEHLLRLKDLYAPKAE